MQVAVHDHGYLGYIRIISNIAHIETRYILFGLSMAPELNAGGSTRQRCTCNQIAWTKIPSDSGWSPTPPAPGGNERISCLLQAHVVV